MADPSIEEAEDAEKAAKELAERLFIPETTDEPSPLESFYKRRTYGQRPIPYDELTVRKGLRVFDAMYATDETVFYAHNLWRMVRLSTGWSLQPPTDKEGNPKPGAEAIRDHVQEHIERWPRWDEFLFQMLDATRQGFKLGELVTKECVIDGKKAWTIDDILVRNSRWFGFDVDDAGRMKPDGILEWVGGGDPDAGGIQATWDPSNTRRHDPDRFVRWVWNPLDSNAYSLHGFSDFRAIYRAYFLGDVMLKGWGETLDTYRHPIPIAICRSNLPAAKKDEFLERLVRASQRRGLVVPEDFIPAGMDPEKAIRFHEVQAKADDFSTIDAVLDKKKMRGVMIGALVSDVGDKGKGSFALGQQHVMLFLTVLEMRGRSLARALSETLFRRLVLMNLGAEAAELTPTLQWPEAGDEKATARATIIKTLADAGVVDPTEPWIRDYCGGIPPAPPEVIEVQEAERDLRIKTAEQGPVPHPEPAPAKPKPTKASAEDPPGKAPGPAGLDGELPERARLGEVEDLERKVDVLAVEKGFDRREAKYAREVNAAWRGVFNGPGGLAAHVRVAIDNPRISVEPSIDGSQAVEAFRRFAVHTMVAGAADAFEEVNRGLASQGRASLSSAETLAEGDEEGGVPKPILIAGLDLRAFAARQGVDLELRLSQVGARIRLRQEDLDTFAKTRIEEARAEVERQVAKLRAETRAMVVQAKSQGRRSRDVLKKELRELEEKWVGVGEDLANETSALFETLESSAYNEGRLRLYEATPKTAVIGLLYSSVLDDRTTPFCRDWDGFMAPRSDPVFHRIVPPNHWRCRSILVSVLAGERSMQQLLDAAARRPSTEPQAGFAGARWIPSVPSLN